MNSIVNARVKAGDIVRTRPLYRYDYGQILKITGLELPSAYEVHFGNRGSDTSVTAIGDADGVSVGRLVQRQGGELRGNASVRNGRAGT